MNGSVDALTREVGTGTPANGRRRLGRARVTTRESLSFLAEVGNTLVTSLDYEATLQQVADLTVPRLACYCELGLIRDGGVKRVGMAHADPEQRDALRGRMLLPTQPDRGPLAEVLRSGESLLMPSPFEAGAGGLHADDERLDLLQLAGATSLLLIPLTARGRVLGVLLLASTRTDRLYGPQDLVLAEELARIAALAIDNARLYSEARQAIRARDDMLSVVSHDLRNPIGAITMAASVVLDNRGAEPRDESGERMLRTILRASRQAAMLIDDLLDLARIDSGRLVVAPQPLALGQLILEAVELHLPLARERDIHLTYTAPGPLPAVMVDHGRFHQLLGNLLANALRFTPPGGRIEVTVAPAADEVVCYVSDTGPGIPAEQLPHVFNRFWQATHGDRGGLGLGLAIVQTIVEAHGGRVWAESEPGRGTRVGFTLLRADGAPIHS